MSIRTEPWPDGYPSWVDLGTSDQAAATAFYSDVLGWNVIDTGEEMGHYGIAMVGEHQIAGMMQQQPDNPAPTAWTTYLACGDVDKTCAAITGNAGTVLMAPMDVGDQGRMAVAQDPTGGVFGIWQARKMSGTTLTGEPGAVFWSEYHSRNPEAARTFYAAVFGYHYTPMEGEGDYVTVNGPSPDQPVLGIADMEPGQPADAPSHWLTYFCVADTDAAVARVSAGGGTVISPAEDTPYGRLAFVQDPQGGVFALAQLR